MIKRIILFFCLFGFLSNLEAQTGYKANVAKAIQLIEKKEYSKSLPFFREAFKFPPLISGEVYDGACAAALSGEQDLAFEWLNLAVSSGWSNINHTKTDSDLTGLHTDKRWSEFLLSMQKALDEKEVNYDKPLKIALLDILDLDQKYRIKIDSVKLMYGFQSPEMQELWKNIEVADSMNLIKVRKILDTVGWLGAEKVGTKANNALFLVIQHSDIAIQEQYLPMMREAVKNKKAESSSLALLEDRVLIRRNKKQIYGSQVGIDSTGKPSLRPLEDPDHVDERRAQMGLETLADYLLHFGIVWNLEAYKKEQH
jgi:hypothetical protein